MREVLTQVRRRDSTSMLPRFTAWHLGKVGYQVPVCEVNYLLPKTAVIKTRAASPGRKFQLFHRKVLQSHGLSETATICARAGTEARPPWRPRSLGSPGPSQHLAEPPRSQNFLPAQIIQLCSILKTKGLLRSLGKTGMSHLSLCHDEQ